MKLSKIRFPYGRLTTTSGQDRPKHDHLRGSHPEYLTFFDQSKPNSIAIKCWTRPCYRPEIYKKFRLDSGTKRELCSLYVLQRVGIKSWSGQLSKRLQLSLPWHCFWE